jgi:hypothetical protein
MKVYGGVELWHHTLLISTFDGGECQLYDAAVLPLLKALTIHCVGGWVIPEPVG